MAFDSERSRSGGYWKGRPMRNSLWGSSGLVAAILVVLTPGGALAQSSPGGGAGSLQFNNGGVFGGDTITTNGAGVLNLNTATVSGHSAPTGNAILGTNFGIAQNFYFYHLTRDNLFIGFSDPDGQYPNPTGNFNTDIGMRAGVNITTGQENAFHGAETAQWITTGLNNTAMGDNALGGLDTGSTSTNGTMTDDAMFGFYAGASLQNGANHNAYFGYGAGMNATTGTFNVLVGDQAGKGGNTTVNSGSNETIVGGMAGYYNTTANNNVLVGTQAGFNVTTAAYNTIIGSFALNSDVSSPGNTGMGVNVLRYVTGGYNVAMGYQAGAFIVDGKTQNTGSGKSIFIGQNAYPLGTTDTNEIVIGTSAIGEGSNTAIIGGSSITSTYLQGTLKLLSLGYASCSGLTTNSAGAVGCTASDPRLKDIDKAPFSGGIEGVEKIVPITFRGKPGNPENVDTRHQAGFNCWNVRDSLPLAAHMDRKGYCNLDPEAITAALVNAVKTQQAEIASLRSEIARLEHKPQFASREPAGHTKRAAGGD
jgi:hypothetical protein